MFPAMYAPTASKALFKSLPFSDSIGPPDTNTQGRFSRAAAISIPGTILSQLGMNTSASNAWARAMHSTLSAISSRVHRE